MLTCKNMPASPPTDLIVLHVLPLDLPGLVNTHFKLINQEKR